MVRQLDVESYGEGGEEEVVDVEIRACIIKYQTRSTTGVLVCTSTKYGLLLVTRAQYY